MSRLCYLPGMNVMRLILCVILAASFGLAARGHSHFANAHVAVICADGAEQTIWLDDLGQPVAPEDCNCQTCLCGSAAQGLAVPPLTFAQTPLQSSRIGFFPRSIAFAPATSVHRNARAPPFLAG